MKRAGPDRKTQFKEWAIRTKDRAVDIVLSPYRLFKLICFWIGFVVLLMCFGMGGYLYFSLVSIPKVHSLSFQDVKKRAIKRTPGLMNRDWVEIDDINRELLHAIVMAEDSQFFSHEGVDFNAIMDALSTNIKVRSFRRGASTISQQVIKNVFLTKEKTLRRKLQEAVLTYQVEEKFSKNQILELYFNIVELGPDIYGIRKGSRYYFKKHPSQVNAAEGAFLSLMLPSPRRNHFKIFKQQQLTRKRIRKIHRILGDMLNTEWITREQYESYIRYDFFK